MKTPMPDCSPAASCESAGGLLPSLLLIGTRKAGTTALANALREHPFIVMPNCTRARLHPFARHAMCVWDKEVRYFSRGLGRDLIDACWYRGLYNCPNVDDVNAQRYTAFDGSPDYLVGAPTPLAVPSVPSATAASLSLSLPRSRSRCVAAAGPWRRGTLADAGTARTVCAFGGSPSKPERPLLLCIQHGHEREALSERAAALRRLCCSVGSHDRMRSRVRRRTASGLHVFQFRSLEKVIAAQIHAMPADIQL